MMSGQLARVARRSRALHTFDPIDENEMFLHGIEHVGYLPGNADHAICDLLQYQLRSRRDVQAQLINQVIIGDL